jgi:signal transduction histidine kinase
MLRFLPSLRGRIFLASALLAVLSIGVAIFLVNVQVTRAAEATLEREIIATWALVDDLRATRTQSFAQMARFIADAPMVKAAVDTNDPPTVQNIADGYQEQLQSNLLLVTSRSGAMLATVGVAPRAPLMRIVHPAVMDALEGAERFNLLVQSDGLLQLVTVPITIGLERPEILGTISVGFLLDDKLAGQLKDITGSDVAFGMDGRVLAATLPPETFDVLSGSLRTPGTKHVDLGGEEYLVLPRTLTADREAVPERGPVALVLRPRSELLRGLRTIHAGLAVTAVVAVLLATVLGFGVARTITRPLANITAVMREVAATGDLTRKIAVRGDGVWEDEDARLLATSFNNLTDSVERFQREMSQKERLTSLGRLSTVIAHEIRNPLTIIKASLHTLRQSDPSGAALREVVNDIDGEVVRLNRIVNEVLDFSRPIRFDLAPADVAGLCRESAAAAATSPGQPVSLDLEPGLPLIETDAERLRIALVNLLVNARNASTEPVVLEARSDGSQVRLSVVDCGTGIAEADLPHVFDPYFTTRRGGTGLGLPIAKNIIEGLGGTIAVSSVVGRGTVVRIDLSVGTADARSAV